MMITPLPKRDLSDVPTEKLEELQRRYMRRLELLANGNRQDQETMAKAQAVGYELGLRITMAEIRKDLAKLLES